MLDGEGHVRLTDFGLSRMELKDISFDSKSLCLKDWVRGSQVGTPGYIAPEVLTRQGYSCKSDVWSLGVMLVELITGVCPFSTLR